MTTHEFVLQKKDVEAFRHAVNDCELTYKVTKKAGKSVFHVRVQGYQDVFRLGYFYKQEQENELLLSVFRDSFNEDLE
jgi:hypothetical protein